MSDVRPRRSRHRAMNEINMVPFIDVMLVLLIIFMVTATVITPGAINIPSAGESSQTPDRRVDVLIDGDGLVALESPDGSLQLDAGDTDAAMSTLAEFIETHPDTPVMLAADRDLPYQDVVSAMQRLREIGVQSLGLSVQ